MKVVGIDNGVTGTIAMIDTLGNVSLSSMPVKKELSYTKTKQWINRVDFPELISILSKSDQMLNPDGSITIANVKIFIERPMINPMRWKASVSAIRCLEATIIALEQLSLPYEYIDSKEWQKHMLPSGLEGPELKKASKSVANRMFPSIEIRNDGDALLIAKYGMLKETGELRNEQR